MTSNEPAANAGEKRMSLATWLFNPFHYLAGWGALGVGLAVLAAVSLIGAAGNVHFDGVLDMHMGAHAPMWVFWAESAIDWLVMALLTLLSGMIFSKSRTRVIDAFGTQALARFPTLPMALIMCLPGTRHVTDALARVIDSPAMLGDVQALVRHLVSFGVTPVDWAQFALSLLLAIVLTIWMIVLMYRAWATSCNFSGPGAVGGFVGLLLLGEIVSKVLVYVLLVPAIV